MPKKSKALAAPNQIEAMIHTLRGTRVMLDSDLAQIYGVSTSRFNEAVKRNKERFPADFMFQLTSQENSSLRSQIAILKTGRGRHRKYFPTHSRNTARSWPQISSTAGVRFR